MRRLIRTLVVLLLVVVAFAGYASIAESRAESTARMFCEDTRIGESMDAVFDRARAAGSDERQTRFMKLPSGERWLPVTFTGAFPLSRHVCSVHGGGVVSEFKYMHMD